MSSSARPSGEALLECRGLSVNRAGREICRGIDLSLVAGGCQGVVGPNGGGKSTLLLGLRARLPWSGRLRVAGEDPAALSRRRMARLIAVMPQRMEFAFPCTVEEMVLLGRAPHRRPWEAFRIEDRRRVHEVLERLGILPLAFKRVDRISGGERRKVFLARALAQDTPLLFLDEPTAGLDPAAQEDLIDLLAALRRREGRTLLVVLHDVRLVPRLCDRVLGLRGGAPVWEGLPGEVLSAASLGNLFGIGWEEYRREGRPPLLVPGGGEARK